MMEPKQNASTAENGKIAAASEAKISIVPTTSVDSSVPKKAYVQIDQKLSKNGRFSIE